MTVRITWQTPEKENPRTIVVEADTRDNALESYKDIRETYFADIEYGEFAIVELKELS